MSHPVFVSYAREDRPVAEAVVAALEGAGIPCWNAPRDIPAGSSWQRSITEAVPVAPLLLLVLSRRAVASQHVQAEVRTAFGSRARVPILPLRIDGVRLEGEFAYMVGGYHILDSSGPPTGDVLARLLHDVGALIETSAPPREPAPVTDHTGGSSEPGGPLNVVVSYRRDARPDDRLARLIERRLTALGHEVFVDHQSKFSLDWGRSIDERLQRADVLIPLLSAKSSRSEMLEWEVRTAHDAAQEGEGRPRLLPVRIAFEESLPAELASLLEAIPPFQWLGPQDDERLVADLVGSLRGPRPIRPPRPLPVGGLPLDSESYVRRTSDNLFHAAIDRRDSIVLVRGARQMGKTSLIARGLDRAEQDGARVAFSDFQRLNRADLASPETFYKALGAGLADDLELDVTPAETWNPSRAANVNFETFLRAEVIDKADAPLVWGLDEIDRLFTCDFGNEVFALFRSWHNARTGKRAKTWKRLTMLIGYATEAHLFITDLNQSPFNVGTTVSLEDFTTEQVADLDQRYDRPLRDAKGLKTFADLVGGHPYLVNRGLFELAESGLSLADFMTQAEREEGLFGDHLRRMLVLLAQDPDLCDVVRGLLRGGRCPTPESFYRLRAAGVILGESLAEARFRNKLYATFLRKHLI